MAEEPKTRRTRKAVRCGKCNRVVCMIEVLLYPTPIDDIVRIEGVTCPSCKEKNDATISVEESLDRAAEKQKGEGDAAQ